MIAFYQEAKIWKETMGFSKWKYLHEEISRLYMV